MSAGVRASLRVLGANQSSTESMERALAHEFAVRRGSPRNSNLDDVDLILAHIDLGLDQLQSYPAQTQGSVTVYGLPADSRASLALLQVGVRGLVLQDEGLECLIRVLHQTVNAEIRVPAPLGDALREAIHTRSDRHAFGRSPLTRCELTVLEHAANGASNKVIARSLQVSVHTIRNHLHNAYQKLGVPNRAAAVAWLAGFPPSQPCDRQSSPSLRT